MAHRLYLVILLGMLNSISLRGSKIVVSLNALDLGASSLVVGTLAALYSALPLVLAVYAGRIIDSVGVRLPQVLGTLCMAVGLAVPFFLPTLAGLIACPTLVGLGHVFFQIAQQTLIASYGKGAERTRNISLFSLGQSAGAFLGPAVAGAAIDHVGARESFALFAAVAVIPAIAMLATRSLVPPRTPASSEPEAKSALDLLENPTLRRVFVMSGVTLTAVELLTFYFPIYGRSIGLSATWIGAVLASYAAAGFAVRVVMPRLAERYGEAALLTFSLFVSGAIYLVMPFCELPWLLASLAFVMGLGLGSAQPLTTVLVFNLAPERRAAEAMGMRIMVNRLTQVAVPLVFGGMGAAGGALAVFLANAAFLLAGGALSFKDLRRRRS